MFLFSIQNCFSNTEIFNPDVCFRCLIKDKSLKKTRNHSNDFKFKKFRDELTQNKMILNSTACIQNRSQNGMKSSLNNTTVTSQTLEEGEIVTDVDETLRTIKQTDNDDENKDEDDDCMLIENTVEEIIIEDDTPIEEDQKEPIFFEDVKGSPTLKFTPHQNQEKNTPQSQRRSCTAVLNSSDVIVLDETVCSNSTTSFRNHKSLDDSVMFVSESAPEFIPLVSENTPQLRLVVPNPFSPKIKKPKQSSNDTLFSKSEKKALENYNVNTYNPNLAEVKAAEKEKQKRMIIIDGSNVAFGHSRNKEFSVKGLEICIEYFLKMGHEVKAVVPQMRLKQRYSTDPKTLDRLAKEGTVVITPCKSIPGHHSSSTYDDRFILQMASELGAVIVSNDNYRDLINENAAFKKLILNRVIGYTWVNDFFMVPKDPYGKHGPSLHEILNRNPKKSQLPQSSIL